MFGHLVEHLNCTEYVKSESRDIDRWKYSEMAFLTSVFHYCRCLISLWSKLFLVFGFVLTATCWDRAVKPSHCKFPSEAINKRSDWIGMWEKEEMIPVESRKSNLSSVSSLLFISNCLIGFFTVLWFSKTYGLSILLLSPGNKVKEQILGIILDSSNKKGRIPASVRPPTFASYAFWWVLVQTSNTMMFFNYWDVPVVYTISVQISHWRRPYWLICFC